jgi:hypothetical protein
MPGDATPGDDTTATAPDCDHAYLRVRPTNDTLADARITEQCEQLHAAIDTTVECLLVVTRPSHSGHVRWSRGGSSVGMSSSNVAA